MVAIQGLHEIVQEQGSSLEQQQADLSNRDRELAELRAGRGPPGALLSLMSLLD